MTEYDRMRADYDRLKAAELERSTAPLQRRIDNLAMELCDAREWSEAWRKACIAWQDWAKELLDALGRQPPHGQHGDDAARTIIAQLAQMAPPVPRCARCGCFVTRHRVDGEERGGCADCECTQCDTGEPPAHERTGTAHLTPFEIAAAASRGVLRVEEDGAG
jgi:hypothetical protein